ncbi:MAG TPA: serine hydrolase domain-containing protein [Candidatus Sulfotelmatobacter sp.]|nr:serine hydrolase domain-containing protein [Candidatus Sulfotelmatobacter sp.]
MKTVRPLLCLCLVLIACSGKSQKEETPKPAQSIQELQQQLEKILKDTHTPGVSVAIVHRDGPEWIAGLGESDVAAKRSTTPDTLFRIGSTSKAFASLSILKLANEGKLSLSDPVHNLIPEVWFQNPWEATDPVRVVDLLEHTTGWDDMRPRDYANQAPDSMGLREALAFDPHPRISRWPPATRMAYCNTGPAVAAYIVEKITGLRFEDYVAANFFMPIGMKTATYFEAPSPPLTLLYHPDGKTPYPYWHILYRPAGSINASADDMAPYVQFYLNRGTVNGVEVMPAASIDRMEIPTRTWAAQEGLKAGYGLSNYWNVQDGFVYHGHNGGVEGGLTEMAYMPDYGVGYFYSINAGNGDAFEKIGKSIRAYVTRNLQKPALPPAAPLTADAASYAGWYEPDSPRVQMTYFLERLLGLARVRFDGGNLLLSSFGDLHQVSVPVTATQFRRLPKKELPSPVATMALLTPNAEGRFIQVGGGMVTMKRIPTALAFLEILLTAWFVLAFVATLIYAPFWLLGGLSKKRRRPAERAIRVWPLISVLSLLAFVIIFIASSDDFIVRMGNLTVWSVGLCLTSITFGIASLISVVALSRVSKQDARKGVRWLSLVVIPPLFIAALYLAYWGVIGLRTWT